MRKYEDADGDRIPDAIENSGPVVAFKSKSKTTKIVIIVTVLVGIALLFSYCS